jgi:hypothetical protein
MKLCKNASDACAVFPKACGGEAMKMLSVLGWYKWFRVGHENMEDDGRSGRPASYRMSEDVGKVQNLVHSHSQPISLCGSI